MGFGLMWLEEFRWQYLRIYQCIPILLDNFYVTRGRPEFENSMVLVFTELKFGWDCNFLFLFGLLSLHVPFMFNVCGGLGFHLNEKTYLQLCLV